MAGSPFHFTLAADVETVVTLDGNYGEVRVTILDNAALTFFNTSDTPIGSVAAGITGQDGNEALPATLCSRTVRDRTSGAASKVRLRSLGTPTISVGGV